MENTVVATNRKAFHEYHILEKFEAGIQLKGSEVKSIREGKASLKQAYILIRKGEAWLRGAHIASYSHTGFEGHEPENLTAQESYKTERAQAFGK